MATIRLQAEWDGEAEQGTEVVVQAPVEELHGSGKALILVHNPSAKSAINVTTRISLTDATGTARTAASPGVAAFDVGTGATVAVVAASGLVGRPVFRLTNATALLEDEGFVAQIVVQSFP